MTFCLSFYALQSLRLEILVHKNQVQKAQLLFGLLVLSLAYLSGSFILKFLP